MPALPGHGAAARPPPPVFAPVLGLAEGPHALPLRALAQALAGYSEVIIEGSDSIDQDIKQVGIWFILNIFSVYSQLILSVFSAHMVAGSAYPVLC